MGNESFFISCASREVAEAFARRTRPWGGAPRLHSGKYIIPSWWLAAFAPEDCVVIPGETGAPAFTACIAVSGACVARLERRRAATLDAFGAHLGDLYDAWVRLVAERFPATILLHTEETFWMMPFANADTVLRRTLAAYAEAEFGQGVDAGALAGFGGVVDGEADHDRPYMFVGWGEGWPPAAPRPPRWEDASIAEICARLAERVGEALRQRWVDVVPELALDILWAAGDHDLVYALIRMRDFHRRAENLAWYAGIDPMRERAHAAAREALSLSSVNLATLATVPLDEPGLHRSARRAAKGEPEKLLLALRLARRAPSEREAAPLWGEARALVWALAAVVAGEEGRRADAEAALAIAFADDLGSPAALLYAFRVFLRCGAWVESIRPGVAAERAKFAAVHEARREGEAALGRLIDRFAEALNGVTAICLGHDLPLEPGGPEAEARLAECYAEGLITEWELDYARARMQLSPREAGKAALVERLASVLPRVHEFAVAVATACDPAACDESQVAERRAALAREVAVAVREGKPSRKRVGSIRQASRALTDVGDAATVGAAVASLERVWGPADSWGRAASGGARVADWTIEILASAAGRSEDAARLLAAAASGLTRACVVAGLARDGHSEAARLGLARLVADPLAPEALPVLVASAVGLDAGCGERLRVAVTQAAAGLPETREDIAAWLRAR